MSGLNVQINAIIMQLHNMTKKWTSVFCV